MSGLLDRITQQINESKVAEDNRDLLTNRRIGKLKTETSLNSSEMTELKDIGNLDIFFWDNSNIPLWWTKEGNFHSLISSNKSNNKATIGSGVKGSWKGNKYTVVKNKDLKNPYDRNDFIEGAKITKDAVLKGNASYFKILKELV